MIFNCFVFLFCFSGQQREFYSTQLSYTEIICNILVFLLDNEKYIKCSHRRRFQGSSQDRYWNTYTHVVMNHILQTLWLELFQIYSLICNATSVVCICSTLYWSIWIKRSGYVTGIYMDTCCKFCEDWPNSCGARSIDVLSHALLKFNAQYIQNATDILIRFVQYWSIENLVQIRATVQKEMSNCIFQNIQNGRKSNQAILSGHWPGHVFQISSQSNSWGAWPFRCLL